MTQGCPCPWSERVPVRNRLGVGARRRRSVISTVRNCSHSVQDFQYRTGKNPSIESTVEMMRPTNKPQYFSCQCLRCRRKVAHTNRRPSEPKKLAPLSSLYIRLRNDLVARFGPIARHKRLAFSCEINGHPPLLPPWVEQAIHQVLERLLKNALTSTIQGRVAAVLNGGLDGVLCVSVSDTGRGMSAKTLAELFETARLAEKFPMESIESSKGLDQCRRLLAHVGSRLILRSAPNIGTLAYFHLDPSLIIFGAAVGETGASCCGRPNLDPRDAR